MEENYLVPEDLYNLKYLSDPQISPDGKQVIFCNKTINQESNRYTTHLFMVEVTTHHCQQYTYGDGNDVQPRWSPDGQKIAFLRTRNGTTQIWILPVTGGEAQQLTTMGEGSFGEMIWSPDAAYIAFEYRPTHSDWTRDSHKKREENGKSKPPRIITRLHYRREGKGFLDLFQHIWVSNSRTGETYQVTDGDWDDRTPTCSPDGTRIAFISNRSQYPDQTPYMEDIWQVDTTGGEPTKISSPDGYKWGLTWSPNGEYLAYIGSETQEDAWCAHNDRIWLVRLQDQQTRCLNQDIDRNAENITLSDVRESGNQRPIWSEDSSRLFYLISDTGNCYLYTVNLHGENHPIIDGKNDICGFSVDSSGSKFACLAAKPNQPAEIYITEWEPNHYDPVSIQITQINSPFLQTKAIAEPDEFWIKSFDQTDIQCWVLKPPFFDSEMKYPLILYIHGGPATQYGNTFFHEFQVLASHGYVVLYTNPRGSSGRDEHFATCIQSNWGDLDFKDLMTAVDYICSMHYIDQSRMAVVGGSYGGFMATWIIGNDNRFKCAISERGISNRHSAVGSNDFPPLPDGYWKGNPWEQPEVLWQQSPLRFAANIRTPLLIIHSEGDTRCPISQAEQLFSALKKLQRDAVFIRYPGETGHGLSRNGPPDLRIDRLQRIVRWLDDHLKIEGND